MVEYLENILAFSLKQDLVYSHQSLAEERLLDPRPRLEGSYKIGSVHPSFCLSLSFLRIASLAFSETQHAVKDRYIVVCDSQTFWKKYPSGKNNLKWPQNMVFGVSKKIMSLVLSGICVKGKFLWFINILRKLHAWEKSSSQVIAKNGSWPMRFQYSLIINILLID